MHIHLLQKGQHKIYFFFVLTVYVFSTLEHNFELQILNFFFIFFVYSTFKLFLNMPIYIFFQLKI